MYINSFIKYAYIEHLDIEIQAQKTTYIEYEW